MKKVLFTLIIIFFSNSYLAKCQTKILGEKNSNTSIISQEKIFVHQNTSFLLTGEYLFYKVYCLNNMTNNLSDFSKIAYVEMVSSDKNLVFRHKIILENGIGQGDYFIPTSVPSGNYKLIAYTKWMRNGEISNFYQNDISIINPFQEDQMVILNNNDISKIEHKVDIKDNLVTYSNKNELIELNISSKNLNNREKVTININSIKNKLAYGNYSISVRKIDSLLIPVRQTAKIFSNANQQKTTSTSILNNPKYLPELRGELFSGKVISKESKKPISNVKVALSIPGKNYIFKIANTNQQGIYYFNIGKEYDNENANIQILHENPDKFELILNQHESINYNSLEFYKFKITSQEKELILNHSINNQIENAYSNEKLDSLKIAPQITSFYNNEAKNYLLDNFTRFKTLKETFLEIVPEVFTRQKKESYTFHVRVYNSEIETGLLPLIIIDGNLIQNQNEILNFKTNKIKSINIVNKMYVYGSQIFEGIISIKTFGGDYTSAFLGDYVKNIKLLKPLANKIYFNQVYEKNNINNRIPDYRRQLLWKPNFRFNKSQETITFYTSDVKGIFEICLEGFNFEGKPVSLKDTFYVK